MAGETEPLLYDRYHTISDQKTAGQVFARCSSYVATPTGASPFSAAPGSGAVLRVRRPHSVMSPDDSVVVVDVEMLSHRAKHKQDTVPQRFLSVDS